MESLYPNGSHYKVVQVILQYPHPARHGKVVNGIATWKEAEEVADALRKHTEVDCLYSTMIYWFDGKGNWFNHDRSPEYVELKRRS